MHALRFGGDFGDWSEAPLLVRHIVDPTSAHNTALALGVWPEAHHGRKVAGVDGEPTARGATARLRPPGRASASFAFDDAGRVTSVDMAHAPHAQETAAFHRSLAEHTKTRSSPNRADNAS